MQISGNAMKNKDTEQETPLEAQQTQTMENTGNKAMAADKNLETEENNEIKNGDQRTEVGVDEKCAEPVQRQASLEAAPDGGWGWVLVFATGISLSISAGFNKSISLFYQQLLERFGQSAALTAGTTSMAGTLRMVLSPFVSALCNKTSHRTVAILGGVLTSAGCILTAFMPSLPWIYVTYSVLQGTGTCMFMVPSLSIVNMYFTNNRGKANSVRSCFAGIGGLYMTQLLSFLFMEFGFTGAILIVGAMLLHLIPAGGLLRPLEKQRRKSVTISLEDEDETSSNIREHDDVPGENTKCTNGISNGCSENKCTVEQRLIGKQENTGMQPMNFQEKSHCNSIQTCIINGSRKCATIFGLVAFRNANFCILALLMGSFNMAASLNTSLLAGLALEKGYSNSQVTLLMSLNFSIEIPCRLLSGFFFDLPRIRHRRLLVYAILSSSIGLIVLCQPFIPLLIPSMAFWMLQNGLVGVYGSQSATVMSDIVPRSTITSTIGLMRLVQGIGNLTGPFLGGLLRDVTGSYLYGYVLAGSQLSLISISLVIMSLYRTRNKEGLCDKSEIT